MDSVLRLYLSECIDNIVRQLLFEASNNISLRDFDKVMKKMGFRCRGGNNGPSRIYTIDYNGFERHVTIHCHGNNVKADSLRHVFDTLREIGWFKDCVNMKKFPFMKWGFSPKNV